MLEKGKVVHIYFTLLPRQIAKMHKKESKIVNKTSLALKIGCDHKHRVQNHGLIFFQTKETSLTFLAVQVCRQWFSQLLIVQESLCHFHSWKVFSLSIKFEFGLFFSFSIFPMFNCLQASIVSYRVLVVILSFAPLDIRCLFPLVVWRSFYGWFSAASNGM